MENERELLKLAAKAYLGVDGFEWNACAGSAGCIQYIPEGSRYYIDWRPLTDDGDALRLAVKLGLVVHVWLHEEGVSVAQSLEHGNAPKDDASDLWFFECVHSHGGDANKATRRAIVRAAAEIGSAMQPDKR